MIKNNGFINCLNEHDLFGVAQSWAEFDPQGAGGAGSSRREAKDRQHFVEILKICSVH